MMAWMVMVAVVAANAKDDKVTLTAGDGKAIVKSEKTATLEFDYSNTIAEGKPLKEHLQTRGENFVKKTGLSWPSRPVSALSSVSIRRTRRVFRLWKAIRLT